MGTRMWTDEHLLRAVATEQSWRGVMRALGLKSSSSMRIVQQHADRLKLDTSHFSGQRRWSDQELREAVADCDSWSEVAEHLRLNSDRRTGIRLRGHAMRLGLDVAHITQQHQPLDRPPSKAYDTGSPRLAELRRAAPSIAAAFFALRGLAVAIPHDQQEYDLLITTDEGIQRVQVKTTTCRTRTGTWQVGIGHRPYNLDKTAAKDPYEPDAFDWFFVVSGDGGLYFIPMQVVAGFTVIYLSAYEDCLVGTVASLLES